MRQPGGELLQHHLRFESGQRCAETEVDPLPERQVPAGTRAADVEAVAIGNHCLVVVGRPQQQQHFCARGQLDVTDRRVVPDLALDGQHRCAEAQELLDRRRDESRITAQRFPLLAVSKKLEEAGRQQPRGRLVAGGQLAEHQTGHLVLGDRPVAALVLTDEIAREIVTGRAKRSSTSASQYRQ